MKYTYEKIIQLNCGQGWEDVSSYEANSRGLAKDRQLLQADFREYARMGYPCRIVFRRTKVKTFYEQVAETASRLGLEISNHESDLYVEDHPEIRTIAKQHDKTGVLMSRFQCNITGKSMLDFPFAYQPFWDKVAEKSKRLAAN